jgi:hypothetical protein
VTERWRPGGAPDSPDARSGVECCLYDMSMLRGADGRKPIGMLQGEHVSLGDMNYSGGR